MKARLLSAGLLGAGLVIGLAAAAPAQTPLFPKGSPAAAKTRARPLPSDPAAPSPAQETEHVVQAGETLGGIAQRTKVPRVIIIEANGLKAPYAVHTGQHLILPRTRHHSVAAGETGFDIAMHYGVPWSAIAIANGLDTDAKVHEGQKLLIPSVLHPAKGEGAAAARLADSQGAKPAAGKAAAGKPNAEKPSSEKAGAEKPGSEKVAPEKVGPDKSKPRLAKAAASDSAADQPAEAPAALPRFVWPAKGHVRRGYVPRSQDDYHDGIDIAGTRGAPVRAVAGGDVVFAGIEPQNYGRLVVIDHGNGWQSAYGFLDKITVAQGDSVKAGERLGLLGHSGRAKSDELHFELRRANRQVDPEKYLPALNKAGGKASGKAAQPKPGASHAATAPKRAPVADTPGHSGKPAAKPRAHHLAAPQD